MECKKKTREREFQDVFAKCLSELSQRDPSGFLTLGFNHLLTTDIPEIVRQYGTVTTVYKGLKYTFSINDVITYNSAVTEADCFDFGLSKTVPVTALFTLHVIPLLAVNLGIAPTLLSSVRTVMLYLPFPTGRSILYTPVWDPPSTEEFLPSGAKISHGKLRSLPPVKTMRNNIILLLDKGPLWKLQVRSAHFRKPERATSSLDFVIMKQIKKPQNQGVISCSLPFSVTQIHVGVLAMAFGCRPCDFAMLVQAIAGDLYEPSIFRPYEISILYDKSVQSATTQEEAIRSISKIFGRPDMLSTGTNQLKTEVFPHINIMFEDENGDVTARQSEMYQAKVFFLAACTSWLILFAAKKISDTPRDWQTFSSLIGPSRYIGMLYRTLFMAHIKQLGKLLRRALISNFKKPEYKQTHIDLIKLYGEPRLSSRILSAVANGSWSPKRKGVTIPLNTNNNDGFLGQLLRVSSSLSTTDSSHTDPRQVHADSYGFMCAASTPDGELVGLVMELAKFALVTTGLEHPHKLCELLELLLSDFLMPIASVLGPDFKTTQRLSTIPKKEATNEEKEAWKILCSNFAEFSNESSSESLSESLGESSNTSSNRWAEEVKRDLKAAAEENTEVKTEHDDVVTFSQFSKTYYTYYNNCGIPTHFIEAEKIDAFVRAFRHHRRKGHFTPHTFLQKYTQRREIHVICEGGQIIKPLIVAENLHLARRDMGFTDMLLHGIVEYVNAAEQSSLCLVAPCVSAFYEHQNGHQNEHQNENPHNPPITHIEMDQVTFVSRGVAQTPFLFTQQGCRAIYAEQQTKQKMTADVKKARGSVLTTQLWYAFNSLVTTKTADEIPQRCVGMGQPCVVAIIADKNQEDAFKINKASIERGLFTVSTTRHFSSEVNKSHSFTYREQFGKPPGVLSCKNLDYRTVQDNGLPLPRTYIPGNGIVMAKTRMTKSDFGVQKNHIMSTKIIDISVSTRPDEQGQVCYIQEQDTPFTKRANAGVVTTRWFGEGDKLTTRHSQKGVGEISTPAEDMPYSLNTGVPVDLCGSPQSIVARMTMGSPLEIHTGKAVALNGNLELGVDKQLSNETTEDHVAQCERVMHAAGFQRKGEETLVDGRKGTIIQGRIFVGVCEISRLIHIAAKKLHGRDIGRREQLTRQPCEGRRFGGGLRFGAMEKAALGCHGAARILQTRFKQLSDPFFIHICAKCKMPAEGNEDIDYAWCRLCNSEEKVFLVSIPFTFLVTITELMAMGIIVRIALSEKDMEKSSSEDQEERTQWLRWDKRET